MSETQQLLTAYHDLEVEMQKFSGLAREVLNCIGRHEFVPETVNTDMMQSIIELNNKEKECFKLYGQLKMGDAVPKQMKVMRDQIEERLLTQKKEEYLEAVKQSFQSLYTEDAEIEKILQSFKEKVSNIQVGRYPLEECLVYIKPFAVFLTMIKDDDPVKSFEQVPVLIEYFGSELVAHITVIKDIYIGDGAADFSMDQDEAPVSATESVMQGSSQPVQTAESRRLADEVVSFTAKQAQAAQSKTKTAAEKKPHPIKEEETRNVIQEEPVKPAKPETPKKVDLKALLEEEGFSEDKLDDPELKQMQTQKKKDSRFLRVKSANTLAGAAKFQAW